MKMKNVNLKIKQSAFGEKTKKMLNEWIDYESFGSVGMGLFEVPPVIERGEGSYLFDCDGKQYLDFLSGFSVSAFGNNNEEINYNIVTSANISVGTSRKKNICRIKYWNCSNRWL